MFINTYKDESASEDGTNGLKQLPRLGSHSAPPHSPQVEIMYRCVPVFSLIHFLTDDRPHQFREMCPDSLGDVTFRISRAIERAQQPLSLPRTAAASFTANLLARERVRVFQN